MIILSKVHLWSPQKLGHNQFFSALYFFARPLNSWSIDVLERRPNFGVGFPEICSNFAFVWGFNFWVCFIRKVHWETILKSTYRYSRTFRPLKTEISHTCTCLMFFFEDWWRKLMMKKLGILHTFDNWLWKLFLARYVLLYFESELKFPWLLSGLTAVKSDCGQIRQQSN